MQNSQNGRFIVSILVGVVVFIGVMLLNPSLRQSNQVKDSDSAKTTDDNKKTDDSDTAKSDETKSSQDYTYVVRSGETYTLLARQSITTYQTNNKLDLSPAQRIASETYLAVNAGNPQIDIDQTVVIRLKDVQNAIKQAQSLSKTDLLAWESYVPYVIFEK